MNRFLYSILFYLATPLLILRLLWRGVRSPAYLHRWSERFARYGKNSPATKTPLVFHAVSVGEVHAAVPLIRQLLATGFAPGILVTTSTPTGSARVTELLGDTVAHVYLPYDYPGAVDRFLARFSPAVMVIMETELWPNLIHCCNRRAVKMLLANARLSEKSLHNYQRMPRLAAAMLQGLDRVTAQSPGDSERLQMLGLPKERVTVAGSMKFDMPADHALLEAAQRDRSALQGRPVLIAASTRAVDGNTEDEKVLTAFGQLLHDYPDLLLVLVPRHPERFDDVFTLARERGLEVARRTGTACHHRAVPLQLPGSQRGNGGCRWIACRCGRTGPGRSCQ